MIDITSRPYKTGDFSACMVIFDSNVPKFFAPEEREEFRQFLGTVNTKDKPYVVLVDNGHVIACGGITTEIETRKASLTWGMVDEALHGKGLGTSLTQARLALAHANPDIDELTLATSQHTRGFYERFGFTVSNITVNGFGPGLDRWDMTLKLR
jgi:N-acetylglutamate synthase-like GNAT family acetyltransferase